MPINHLSPLNDLTDDHLKCIGKIVVEWSNIEFLLGVVLTRLLLTPEYLGRSYTDNLSAAKIQECINEAVQLHKDRYSTTLIKESMLSKIAEINDQVTFLRSTRNKFAHFCWSRESEQTILGISYKGGSVNSRKQKNSWVTYSIHELNEFYTESYHVVEKLSLIVRNLPSMEEDGIDKKLFFPHETFT